MLKIVILGRTATAETSIFKRFLQEESKRTSQSLAGIDIYTKLIEYEPHRKVLLSLWNVSRSFQLEEVRTDLYHDADGAIIVFNPFDIASFKEARSLIDDIRDFLDEIIPFVLIGDWTYSFDPLKAPLDRVLILDFTYREDGLYIEITPTSDQNVQIAFLELTRRSIQSTTL